MVSPAASPIMIGRERELAALLEMQRSTLAGAPRGAVVTGEAGIGKSRLLQEFIAKLPDDVAVAFGRCVGSGALAAPLQPVRELLRDLVSHFGADAVTTAAGPIGQHLSAVLPELADGRTTEITQEQLHDAVRLVLERLSLAAPLAVVVEDVHWTDLATLDLLRTLLRSLRHGRVLVVLSHRTADLRRDHPLHALLLDLDRARDTQRIELDRLSADETTLQASMIGGIELARERAAEIFLRSEGVPFFVEELVSVERSPRQQLPDTLRELLLARFTMMSAPAMTAVRTLATGGVRVEHRLAEIVHGGDPGAFDAAMREAVAEHLLQQEPTGYRFRHALIQEAVHDDLLPGERQHLHSRWAEALEAEASGAGQHAAIAQHWLAAGDLTRSLPALRAAAVEARASGAPHAAAQLGEQSLDLWRRVDDPEALAGCRLSQLFLEVANSYWLAGDRRALSTLDRALDEIPVRDLQGRALLLQEWAVVSYGEGVPGGLERSRRALALLPESGDDRADMVRARVLTGLAIFESIDRVVGATERLEEAVAFSRALMGRTDDAGIETQARSQLARGLDHLGIALATDGAVDAGLACLNEAREHAGPDMHGRLRHGELMCWLQHHLGAHTEAIRIAQAGAESATTAGMVRRYGLEIDVIGAWSLLAVGDLTGVAAVVELVHGARPPRTTEAYLVGVEVELQLLGGDTAAARSALLGQAQTIADMRATEVNDDMLFARLDAHLARIEGDLVGAWRAIERIWAWPVQQPGPVLPLLAEGAEVLAQLRRSSAAPSPDTTGSEQRLRRTFDAVAVWDVAEDWRALIDAELSGADGRGDDATAWRAAVTAAARGRLPVRLHVHALHRLAEASLGAGDRATAATAVADATAIARGADLRHALHQIDELASRARLAPRGQRRGDDGPAALTPRERQVLALVAAGLTNREIGRRLFISEKTASVHVSAILRKMGASTRSEAAGRASDLLA